MKISTPTKIKELKLLGKYNYYLQANIKGDAPYQSSTLIISAFTNETRKVPIEITCKYFRIKNKTSNPLIGINSNIYNISSADNGCIIRVEVYPQENLKIYTGVAEIQYGPIRIEPNLKYTLENILAIGGSKFPITIISEIKKTENFLEDYSLLLTNDHIRIIKAMNDNQEKSVKFKYYLGQPQIILNNNDPTQIQLMFKGEEEYDQVRTFFNIENKKQNFEVILQTVSRTSKDLIILALRSFSVKNYLINSKAISYIDNLFDENEKESKLKTDFDKKTIDPKAELILEIEAIKKESYQLSENNKDLNNEKTGLLKEIRALEEELEKTIQMYTNLIKEMKIGNMTVNESLLDMSMIGKKDEMEFRKKNKLLELENKNLEGKIKALSNQVELLQNFNKNQGFFDETQILQDNEENMKTKRIEESENMIRKLKEQIENLKQNNNLPQNQQLLEKKYIDAKKLNTVLLEEIASFKLKSDSALKDLQAKEAEILSLKNKYENNIKMKNNLNLKENDIMPLENALNETKHKNMILMREIEDLKNKSNLFQNKDIARDKDGEILSWKNKYEDILKEFEKMKNQNLGNLIKQEENIKQLENSLFESNQKIFALTKQLDETKTIGGLSQKVQFFREDKEELIGNLKKEIDQLKDNFDLSKRIAYSNYQFNDKMPKNQNDDDKKMNSLLEIELKHLKLELENNRDKIIKYEESIHQLEILINEEKHKHDLDLLETKNYKNQIETIKAENGFFQNENTELLEDRKKKMDKIIFLETENRNLKSANFAALTKSESPEFKELKSKNFDYSQEIIVLKSEKGKLISEMENLMKNNENYQNIIKENENLKDEIEDYKIQITEQQFKINSMLNDLNVQKTNNQYKPSYNNYDYDLLFQDNKKMKHEIENYKLKMSELTSRINLLSEEITFLKSNNNILKNSQKLNIDQLSSLDINTQEIIENLQTERKALLNKLDSMQKELFKLQKEKGFRYEMNPDNEIKILRKTISDLEAENQLLLKEKANPYNKFHNVPENKNNSRNVRNIFG